MMAHVLYSYEECNSTSNAKHLLDMLIPVRPDGFNAQCSMFITRDQVTRKRRAAKAIGNLPGVE